MPFDENYKIKELLTVTNDLERLAESLIADSEDEVSLQVYGMLLDSAYKLRNAAVNLWKTRLDDNGSKGERPDWSGLKPKF